jgi:hypothetical protein
MKRREDEKRTMAKKQRKVSPQIDAKTDNRITNLESQMQDTKGLLRGLQQDVQNILQEVKLLIDGSHHRSGLRNALEIDFGNKSHSGSEVPLDSPV